MDKNTDENVQLKTLQTALTLLQSPLRPRSEEQIGAVLGVCLRLTNRKGHKDAVLTTAAATVRQAVALVLSYVDVEAELQTQAAAAEAGEGGEAPGGAAFAAQKLVEDLCNIASGGWAEVEVLFVLLAALRAGQPAVFKAAPSGCHTQLGTILCTQGITHVLDLPIFLLAALYLQALRRCGSSPPPCHVRLCWSCWTLCWPTRQTCSAACRPSKTRWPCA